MKAALIGDSHSTVTFEYLRPFLEENGVEVSYYKPKVGWSARAFITRDDVNIRDLPQGLDVAVIALGGNNSELDDAKYFPRLDTFIDRLKESGIKRIVWLGPMYTDATKADSTAKRHDYTREAQRRYFDGKKWHWIDMYPYSQSGHSSDGIHFTRSTYEQMIESTKEEILKNLKGSNMWTILRALASVATISYIAYKYVQGDLDELLGISDKEI